MRSWMLALSMVIGLGVVAGPRSMTVLGQEKEGDDYTGPYSVVAKWPLPRTDTYTRFGDETPGGSGTLYLTFNKVS